MKEKIIKLFFEEEVELVCSDNKIDKDAKYLLAEDDINWLVRFFKFTNICFLIHHVSKIVRELIYPSSAYSFDFLYNSLFGFIIFLFFNNIIDYFYIKEMIKNSINNFNKKIKNKIKFNFISTILISMFSIFNIGYGITMISKFNDKADWIIVIVTGLMLIISIIIGIKLVNYFFKQFDLLNKETDGIV